MNQLIGLAGPALVGKSTMAEMLCREYGFEEKAFADPLKESLMALTGLGRKYFYDQNFKHKHHQLIGMSPRKLMQLFGTEFVRNTIRKDFWVERMRHELSGAVGSQVISDIRFNDEADLIRSQGGIVVILKREGIEDESGHESESGIRTAISDVCVYVPNGIKQAEFEMVINLTNRNIIQGLT